MTLTLTHALVSRSIPNPERTAAAFRIKAEEAINKLMSELGVGEKEFLALVFRVSGKTAFHLDAGEDDFGRIDQFIRRSPAGAVECLLVLKEGDIGVMRSALYNKKAQKVHMSGRFVRFTQDELDAMAKPISLSSLLSSLRQS